MRLTLGPILKCTQVRLVRRCRFPQHGFPGWNAGFRRSSHSCPRHDFVVRCDHVVPALCPWREVRRWVLWVRAT